MQGGVGVAEETERSSAPQRGVWFCADAEHQLQE